MTPASKEEIYLAKLCGESRELPYPASRLEYYYAKLCGMNVPLPAEPLSRPELYLAYLCGMDVKLSKPVSRKEIYMAKVCGIEVDKLPEPLSKSEQYWAELVSRITTMAGSLPLSMEGMGFPLVNYCIYGNYTISGNPTPATPSVISFCGTEYDTSPSEIKYKLPVTVYQNDSRKTVDIFLNEPLRRIGAYCDYLDYSHQQIIRQIGKINLGTLTWRKSASNHFVTAFPITQARSVNNNGTGNAICSVYQECSANQVNSNDFSFSSCLNGVPNPYIHDSEKASMSVEEFQSAMSGIYMFYVMNTPVIEKISLPFISTFIGTNEIDIQTSVTPSKVEISYQSLRNRSRV